MQSKRKKRAKENKDDSNKERRRRWEKTDELRQILNNPNKKVLTKDIFTLIDWLLSKLIKLHHRNPRVKRELVDCQLNLDDIETNIEIPLDVIDNSC